jgi:hypothetical protein
MRNKVFLKSFSVGAEELDKNSGSIRPLDREFNEVSRKNESGMLVTTLRVSVIFCMPTVGKYVLFAIATTCSAKVTKHFLLLRLVCW